MKFGGSNPNIPVRESVIGDDLLLADQEQENDVRKLMRTTANQTESFVNERLNTAQDIENKSKEAFQAENQEFQEAGGFSFGIQYAILGCFAGFV